MNHADVGQLGQSTRYGRLAWGRGAKAADDLGLRKPADIVATQYPDDAALQTLEIA
jgi:hypothetical protein